MKKVKTVKALPGYRLEVELEDGTRGTLSLQDELFGPVFEPLREPRGQASLSTIFTRLTNSAHSTSSGRKDARPFPYAEASGFAEATPDKSPDKTPDKPADRSAGWHTKYGVFRVKTKTLEIKKAPVGAFIIPSPSYSVRSEPAFKRLSRGGGQE
jgi:hypothetical protein